MGFHHYYLTRVHAPSGALPSGAALLALGKNQALAVDFTDDFFQALTGHYGSAYIKDIGTPANNYDSVPFGKLVYASPYVKMCVQSDGSLKFGAHNIALQSEDFTNESWVKTSCSVSGSTVTLTGATTAKHLGQVLSPVAGAPYVISFDVTAGTHAAFQVLNNGDSDAFANFDLSNGTVGTSGAKTTPTITNLGSGRYRLSTLFSGATLGTSWRLYAVNNSSAAFGASTSSTGTFTVHRAHIRRAPSVDSYLMTTAAAVYALPFEWVSGSPKLRAEWLPATNIFLNSTVGATQNCTVSATAYTLSFYGTGTITLTGTSTAGPLIGTGANDLVSLTFTPTAGTLTLTVAGSCSDVQLETGSVATSRIQTYSASLTRLADSIKIPQSAFSWNSGTGVLEIDGVVTSPTTSGSDLHIVPRSGQTHINSYLWVPA